MGTAALDKITDVFLNWQAVLVSFGVFIILGVIRAMGTQKDDKGNVVGGYAQHHVFQRLLPLFPYVLAAIFCCVPKAPIPTIVAGSWTTKIIYSIYVGWLSGFSYQLLRSLFTKAGSTLPDQPQ